MLKELCTKKIHTRTIDIATYSLGETDVIVEGILRDHRLLEYFLVTGEKKQPGELHHMIIRMRISGYDMTITEIEVDMPGVPREGCIDTRTCLDGMVGQRIASGFTRQVKQLAGGPKGCTHLVSLITAMAQAAVQGFWANLAQKPDVGKKYANGVLTRFLEDTCYVWRAGGENIKRARERLIQAAHNS